MITFWVTDNDDGDDVNLQDSYLRTLGNIPRHTKNIVQDVDSHISIISYTCHLCKWIKNNCTWYRDTVDITLEGLMIITAIVLLSVLH